jgi:hypothetical protein
VNLGRRGRPRRTGGRGDWDATDITPPGEHDADAPVVRAPLESRSELVRGKPLERRTPIKPMSDKGAVKLAEWERVLPLVLARDGHRCQAVTVFPDVHCQGRLTAHHKRLRSQGGGHDPDNLVTVCNNHHLYIHLHPEEAAAHGFIIRTGGDLPDP